MNIICCCITFCFNQWVAVVQQWNAIIIQSEPHKFVIREGETDVLPTMWMNSLAASMVANLGLSRWRVGGASFFFIYIYIFHILLIVFLRVSELVIKYNINITVKNLYVNVTIIVGSIQSQFLWKVHLQVCFWEGMTTTKHEDPYSS